MKKLLLEQNPHWQGKLQSYAQRVAFTKLASYLPLKQVITITGIRRCGKSTLAKMSIRYLIEQGVEPGNILFVNLEQPLFLEYRHDPSYLDQIYNAYLRLCNPQGKTYVIFDEIQFFENWQLYIKSKYESSDIKFIVTGSNSSMLSAEINTLLTGRTLTIHLDTFSFSEFLSYRGIVHADPVSRTGNRVAIDIAKKEFITWGGFYEVMSLDNSILKKEILISYAKNIIYRDLVPRFNLRNAEIVERLFFYLLSQSGNILNYTQLAATFGMSDKSMREYLGYFEDVFLIKRLDRFHSKPKERIKSAKKLYLLDNGFLSIAPKNSPGLGQALENWVFNHLYQQDQQLSYLREQLEVDFYCRNKLYQVAFDLDDEKTCQREVNAFAAFKQQSSQCLLVTYNKPHRTPELTGCELVSVDELVLGNVTESDLIAW